MILNNDAQKHTVEYGFEHNFMTLDFLELNFFLLL